MILKILRLGFAGVSFSCAGIFLLAFPHRHDRCPAQGKDPRMFSALVCPLEQAFSWHSDSGPAHLHTTLYSAVSVFPPYVVTNWRSSSGGWMMFRLGWRYDRDWRGYIGPSLAYKPVAKPLLYY